MSLPSILGLSSHHVSVFVSPTRYGAPSKYPTFESVEGQVNGGEAERGQCAGNPDDQEGSSSPVVEGLPSGAELLGGWDRAMIHVLSSLCCWGLAVSISAGVWG